MRHEFTLIDPTPVQLLPAMIDEPVGLFRVDRDALRTLHTLLVRWKLFRDRGGGDPTVVGSCSLLFGTRGSVVSRSSGLITKTGFTTAQDLSDVMTALSIKNYVGHAYTVDHTLWFQRSRYVGTEAVPAKALWEHTTWMMPGMSPLSPAYRQLQIYGAHQISVAPDAIERFCVRFVVAYLEFRRVVLRKPILVDMSYVSMPVAYVDHFNDFWRGFHDRCVQVADAAG